MMFHFWRAKEQRFLPLTLGLLLASSLVACGGDEEPKGGQRKATPQAQQANAQYRDYCAKVLAIETFPEPEVDFEALTPAQQTEESKKFAGQLVPLAEEARGLAPTQIRSEINTLADAVKKVQETGDFEAAFGDPQVEQASDRAHAFDLENCGWKRVDVTAVNYAFQGIPSTLEAGTTSFELSNKGTEPHELVVLRINDDVTESAEELLKLPQEEGEKKTQFAGATFADPNDTEYAIAELREGRYAVACFVPVGSKPEGQGEPTAGASPTATTSPTATASPTATSTASPTASPTAGGEGEEGPPHFTRGMFAEFRVG